ncbi:TetR/AcrR family transcriptional regulator [Nocardia sp. NPDC004415]
MRTRALILDAATRLLVEQGYAALTTVAVQAAAGVSRGALLHHFPTMKALTTALVAHLVERNEAGTCAAVALIPPGADAVDRALSVLSATFAAPPALAEQELWAAARTDPELARALRAAERQAGRDLFRVVDGLFGVEIVTHPNYPAVRDLTVTVLRGLSASRPLRTSARSEAAILAQWARVARMLLDRS